MGPRQRRARSRSKTHTIPIVLVSVLGFVLIVGIAFGVGMMNNVSRWLSDLPDYTDSDQYLVSQPSTILDANGNEIASLYVENRESITIDQVSQYVLDGTVATEDVRFYEHHGVDLVGIARAALVTLSGGHEGASTITQQLVRNTILSEEQFDDTIERKVREAYIALKMEDIYSKEEILMMYLNTIYYGHGAYGIETAAQTYFSKSASDLTLAEAALLVGLPNAPGQYDPTENPDLALERRNTVLDRMLSAGYITQEEHDAAQAEELVLNVTEMPETGTLAYPYFVDYVKSQLEEMFTTDLIYKGGLTIKTTIDPTLQAAAEEAAIGQLEAVGADDLDVGMVAIDPDTGYIKVMVGGRNYNDEAGAHTNHALTRRSPGSTMKAITLAAAIKAGMNPQITISCASPMNIDVDGTTVKIQNYGNNNYGTRSLQSATVVSSNTAYVQVQAAIGYSAVEEMAADLGIDTEDEAAEFKGQANLTLGTCNLSPLEMAEAYATFANGGYHREAVAITEVLARDGTQIYVHQDSPEQVLTTGEAEAVNTVLESVVTTGTEAQSAYPYNANQPVAGKTGTASNAADQTTDVWFVGYSPQLSVAIWTGRSGTNAAINYTTMNLPIPIFRNFMNVALAGLEREEFPTGETPSYKANSIWGFSAKIAETKEEEEEEEEKIEEEETDTDSSDNTTTTPSTGTDTGTDSGNSDNSGTTTDPNAGTDSGTTTTPTTTTP